MTETTTQPKPKAARAAKALTPTELATQLAGKGKAAEVAKTFVRPYLRRNFTRKPSDKGKGWTITPAQAKAIRAAYRKGRKA